MEWSYSHRLAVRFSSYNYSSRTFDYRNSGGSITLQSNNPFDPPLVDPGLLVTDFDLFTARESIKKAYQFVEAPVWKDYIIAPTIDLLNMTTDELDEFIRNTGSSTGHIVSTAAMSAKDASYGVASLSLLLDLSEELTYSLSPCGPGQSRPAREGRKGPQRHRCFHHGGRKTRYFPILTNADHIEAFCS